MNQIIKFVQDVASHTAAACETWLDFVAKETSSLAWPILTLIFLIVFRKQIAAAITRIRSIGREGAQFDAQRGAPPRDPLSSTEISSKAGLSTTRPAIKWFDPLRRQADEAVRRDSAFILALGDSSPITTLQELAGFYLVRLTLERLHRSIFESQIELIETLQIRKVISISVAEAIWSKAKAAFPDLHKTRTFEQWLGYLQSFEAVAIDESSVRLLPAGEALLPYMAENGLFRTNVG